jgi:amidophosphoribosyltransferase
MRFGAKLAEGKTKIIYAHESDPSLVWMVHKDAITAGDGARRNVLPGKGKLSGRTTANVYRLLAAAGVPTHYVDAPADDVMLVRRCQMVPIEFVLRRIATGSYLKRHPVPEGTRFDPLVIEFFFKDDAQHDPLVSEEWVHQQGIARPAETARMRAIGQQVFSLLEAAWAEQGVQLVDLKIEFGRDAAGRLLLADVIDNDSWRLWPGGRKEEMLDKQVYRNLLEVTDEALARVLAKYQQVAELTDRFVAPRPSAGAEGVTRWADGPREACGVFGIWAPGADVARTTLIGLMALQHRGQESAGLAVARGDRLQVVKGMGRVDQAFFDRPIDHLVGHAAIGHTRYSTTGAPRLENAQPFVVTGPDGPIALAHNGNVVNAVELRRAVRERGGQPTTGSDSELLAWLIALGRGRTEERIRGMMALARGAYSLAVLEADALYAVRDPYGLRPLCLGRRGDHWIVASESCALDTVGAELVRDVQPGEVLRIGADGLRSDLPRELPDPALCIFELIYFARPDSVLAGQTTYEARVAMGRELAREHPVAADLVIGVPDSGVPAAIGYAQELGLPLGEGLVKNRYVGRTFIQPDQHSRQAGIRLKFNPLRGAVAGRRVVVVDDSIVRGNTVPKIVELLRRGGAAEVHVRVSSPPITDPCHFGVDMGQRAELIASALDVEAIRRHVGADSLGYLSLAGLLRAAGGGSTYCLGCLTGRYPLPVEGASGKEALEASAQPPGAPSRPWLARGADPVAGARGREAAQGAAWGGGPSATPVAPGELVPSPGAARAPHSASELGGD